MQGIRRFIGLMSGTSCDGVDAVLVEITGSGLSMQVRFVDHGRVNYPDLLRPALLKAMAPARSRTESIARLNVEVGHVFADCCVELMQRCGLQPRDVSAIGSHGQTICHMPRPASHEHGFTLQIGEPAVIAARTGVAVVADFRQQDMAVGGQGAPVVPWTDHVLLHSAQSERLVQNVGGIANVTYLPVEEDLEEIIAFDTGPGCMVIDELTRRASHNNNRYDPAGRFAARGQPDRFIVEQMLELPFFTQPPPKSTGREQFGRSFTNSLVKLMKSRNLNKYDILATATQLTASSIAQAYRRYLQVNARVLEVILCGGGARNKTLIRMLQDELPNLKLHLIDDFGIPLQAKEGVSFAMLAAACLDGVPANLPHITGAQRAVVLGKVVNV